MYYLIQSNIYFDPEHFMVFEVLEDLGLAYETIELQPDATSIEIESDRKDVFIYGSVKLARLAKANTDWNPGSFYGGNHNFEVISKHYSNHLLNANAQVFEFEQNVEWKKGESKFIKPYQDAKVFTGKVFTELKWNDFVHEALTNPKTDRLNSQTLVQASTPQKLYKEARLWIVGEQVVGSIYYQFHGDVPFQSTVEEEGIEFAKDMIAIFNVADAFVMDIGLCNDGWKIVEVNCINSAGLYNLNVRTLFRALEAFF
ncbi:MAG: ATP-grasp domain-containing protein [Crocinitomix sp.]|nr:ATP-grasp domain-containing protein [Crocinitomix sp.]